MEYIVIIIIIILATIYFIAQDSKKETTKERYGEAIGSLAQMTAESISNIAHDIAEPASKKQIRLAKEALAMRHRRLYTMHFYNDKDYIEKLFTVDNQFKTSLEILGLSENRWKRIARHIFYVGIIRVKSRDCNDYSKKNTENLRQYIIEGGKYQSFKEVSHTLKEALRYFGIPTEEWIKYGDTVLEMYNVNDNKDIEEYGYIAPIKPMQNNMHLL